MRSKAMRCIQVLEEQYGETQTGYIDPVDLLVQTMLSQNTTDTNSFRAFRNLKAAYPCYEDLLAAPQEDISELIRVGGLAEMKSARIKEALRRIKADSGTGSVDLSFLADLSASTAKEYLLALPGVGPKTAAVVLLFAFGFPIMPVDTHVYRVSRRIGLVPEKASIKETERILEEITPQSKYLSLHLNLIKHGRLICRARAPLHDRCVLRHLCDFCLRATSLK